MEIESKPVLSQQVLVTADNGVHIDAEVIAIFPANGEVSGWVLGWRTYNAVNPFAESKRPEGTGQR